MFELLIISVRQNATALHSNRTQFNTHNAFRGMFLLNFMLLEGAYCFWSVCVFVCHKTFNLFEALLGAKLSFKHSAGSY